jgi:hypothetical protein
VSRGVKPAADTQLWYGGIMNQNSKYATISKFLKKFKKPLDKKVRID